MIPTPHRLALFFSFFPTPLLAATTYQTIILGPANVESYAYAIGGGQQGGSLNSIPTLWTGTPDSAIPLTTGAQGNVLAVDGSHQAGYVVEPNNLRHATLWSGSASSLLDLNPQGFSQSTVTSLLDDTQAGSGTSTATGQTHALLWHGSPDSAIDLNPPGYLSSSIGGISDEYLVGSGTPDTPAATSHILLWNRATGHVTDLGHPGFLISASAAAIAGHQIVGTGRNSAGDSSLFFFSDLGTPQPQNFVADEALMLDTNDTTQVGVGIFLFGPGPDHNEAIYWTGTRDSLTRLMPGTQSGAYAIDAQNRIVGYYADGPNERAVLWLPLLPEPTLLPLLLIISFHIRPRPRQ